MKRTKAFKGICWFIASLFAGCASYTPTLAKLNASGPNIGKAVQGDLTLYVDEYATPEKSQKAFDTKLAEEGVLPLLIQVTNEGRDPYEIKVADIVVRGDAPLKAITPEEAAGKAKRSAVGRAVGWSLIVPIIAIPIAAAASATHTSKVNKQILQDFSQKAFQDGVIAPHKDQSGFLFLELEKERKDLSGLSLEVTAKNLVTGELVAVAMPLPAANFTVKEKSTPVNTVPRHGFESPEMETSGTR